MKKIPDTRQMILCAVFAAMTGAGALIAFPLPISPVPVTLQNFFVLLSGALLGAYSGAVSQLIYLAMGIMGLPVFAKGSAGPGVLMGPTGGYLAGFVPASFFVGLLLEKTRSRSLSVISGTMVFGLAVIYIFGTLWLMFVTRLGPVPAVSAGVLPFLVPDLAKAFLAALVVRKMKGRIRAK